MAVGTGPPAELHVWKLIWLLPVTWQ